MGKARTRSHFMEEAPTWDADYSNQLVYDHFARRCQSLTRPKAILTPTTYSHHLQQPPLREGKTHPYCERWEDPRQTANYGDLRLWRPGVKTRGLLVLCGPQKHCLWPTQCLFVGWWVRCLCLNTEKFYTIIQSGNCKYRATQNPDSHTLQKSVLGVRGERWEPGGHECDTDLHDRRYRSLAPCSSIRAVCSQPTARKPYRHLSSANACKQETHKTMVL